MASSDSERSRSDRDCRDRKQKKDKKTKSSDGDGMNATGQAIVKALQKSLGGQITDLKASVDTQFEEVRKEVEVVKTRT